jgi:hypothetical protein
MEIRTRIYPTECRFYCEKCAVFLDQGQEKNPNMKYLPKEEFEKIDDHMLDDSVINVMTMGEILSVLGSLGDIGECVEFFLKQKESTDATVKFYGEMIPSGPMMRFIKPEDRTTQLTESLHQCNNPSCKAEILLPRDYPYTDHTVGRMVREPRELLHPDEEIRNITKKHVGSTVQQNFKTEESEKPC